MCPLYSCNFKENCPQIRAMPPLKPSGSLLSNEQLPPATIGGDLFSSSIFFQ